MFQRFEFKYVFMCTHLATFRITQSAVRVSSTLYPENTFSPQNLQRKLLHNWVSLVIVTNLRSNFRSRILKKKMYIPD